MSFFPSLSLFQANSLEHRNRCAHSPAWASKALSRRCTVPSTPREGTRCLLEQREPCIKDFIGFLCKPRNISLFLFLFHFLIFNSGPPGSSPLKDPNKWHPEQGHWYTWHFGRSDSRLLLRSVSTKTLVKRLETICLFYFTICLKLRDFWFSPINRGLVSNSG